MEGVSIEVAPGERLGVLGPNGGGKSTLLKLVLGLLEPREGEIRVGGFAPVEARRRGLVGYLPQKVNAGLDWPLSVRQVVAMPVEARLRPWQRRQLLSFPGPCRCPRGWHWPAPSSCSSPGELHSRRGDKGLLLLPKGVMSLTEWKPWTKKKPHPCERRNVGMKGIVSQGVNELSKIIFAS